MSHNDIFIDDDLMGRIKKLDLGFDLSKKKVYLYDEMTPSSDQKNAHKRSVCFRISNQDRQYFWRRHRILCLQDMVDERKNTPSIFTEAFKTDQRLLDIMVRQFLKHNGRKWHQGWYYLPNKSSAKMQDKLSAVLWQRQGRRVLFGNSNGNNKPWFEAKVDKNKKRRLEVDHIVPKTICHRAGIAEEEIVGSIENIWIMDRYLNQQVKRDLPLHKVAKKIGCSPAEVEKWKMFYIEVVKILVAKKQWIDPTYEPTEERLATFGLTMSDYHQHH